MQDELLIPVSWRARPRSFVALMSVYESNYIRLLELAGDVATGPLERRSRIDGDCELLLNVLERSRYTTELQLTYLMPLSGHEGSSPDDQAARLERFPDLRLRAYSDARLAEALQVRGGAAHPALRALHGRPERELHQCWTLNMMLNKWLEYCMERGHRFD